MTQIETEIVNIHEDGDDEDTVFKQRHLPSEITSNAESNNNSNRKSSGALSYLARIIANSSILEHHRDFIIAAVFFINTVTQWAKLTRKLSLEEYLTIESLHQLFPLAVSGALLVQYYCIVADVGYIEIFLDSNNNAVSGLVDDEEQQSQQMQQLQHRTRKIYYIRYITWLFSWPLVLFAIQLHSASRDVLMLLENIEPVIVRIVLIEGLVSCLLVSSFTYRAIKAVFGIVAFAIQIYVIVSISMVHYTAILGLFYTTWLLYLAAWLLCECLGVISDNAKESLWGMLDLVHFAVIPILATS